MGKLWQRAENTALNAVLESIKDKIQSGEMTSAHFVELAQSAHSIALSQGLIQTSRELQKLVKATPTDR